MSTWAYWVLASARGKVCQGLRVAWFGMGRIVTSNVGGLMSDMAACDDTSIVT